MEVRYYKKKHPITNKELREIFSTNTGVIKQILQINIPESDSRILMRTPIGKKMISFIFEAVLVFGC